MTAATTNRGAPNGAQVTTTRQRVSGLAKHTPVKTRRTQAERTTETRTALVEAAIRVIHKLGYGSAATALIAEEAGVSRGAILHHFGTRAELMAEVVRYVFENERTEYERLETESHLGGLVADWPAMLWRVFSQPSGLAVLEILQAARSDAEISERIKSTQQAIEERALATMRSTYGTTDDVQVLDQMRLLVWAIRGLAIGQVLVKDPQEIERSVELFHRILEAAEKAGVLISASDTNIRS